MLLVPQLPDNLSIPANITNSSQLMFASGVVMPLNDIHQEPTLSNPVLYSTVNQNSAVTDVQHFVNHAQCIE